MKFGQQLIALLWIIISGVVCLDSIRAGIGNLHSPRSGFFPFWLGVILAMLAIMLIIVKPLHENGGKIADLWKGTKWTQVVWVMVSTLIYSAVLDKLGYLIATFLLMVFLLCIGERKRVWIKTTIALIVVLTSYIIFSFWLKVSLPGGILSF